LTKLAGIGALKVISRTSSAKYKSKPENLKTVARELGVATLLEGSVQKAGEKVRVNVQLLDARRVGSPGPRFTVGAVEWRRALTEFERALELDPRDAGIPTEIGNLYLSVRRWSEARRALTRALALDPHNINAGFHLAQTYVNSTGDVRRARQAWEGIPDNKTGFSPYGIVMSQMISETAYLDVLERRFADALKIEPLFFLNRIRSW
jgi:tetratricopeptide (TPR) repeat protein